MNYYETLGVDKTATQKEIKAAYRRLAQTMHPDKGGDEAAFVQLQQAYDTLHDPETRDHYDRYGTKKPTETLMDKARQHLAALFQQVIGQPLNEYTDLTGSMNEIVAGVVAQIGAVCSNLQAERRKNLMVSKRLTVAGNDQLLLDLLRTRRVETWKNYREVQEKRQVLELVTGLIAGYVYEVDVRPEPVDFWNTGSGHFFTTRMRG